MTPKIVKSFIIAIVTCSLFAGVIDRIFPFIFDNLNFTYIFSLSLVGLKHFFVWQPLTYLFFYPALQGIHPGYLINLGFSMFVLWRVGTAICMSKGVKHFLYLFFGSGLFASLIAFIALFSSPVGHIYAGTTPAIFAMLMGLIILFPNMELMLFLTLPVKAKWLIVIILGSTLLIDVSNAQYINFFVNSSAMFFGYLYGVIAWRAKSPFATFWPFEEFLHRLTSKGGTNNKSTIDQYANTSSRIYDFRTGERVIDDDTFIDACLSKISSEGRKSLSWREKFRMWRISKKRARAAEKHNDYTKSRN